MHWCGCVSSIGVDVLVAASWLKIDKSCATFFRNGDNFRNGDFVPQPTVILNL
jgi:hypothetical protein